MVNEGIQPVMQHHTFPPTSRFFLARPGEAFSGSGREASQEYSEYAGQKNAVKRAGPANRENRSPKPLNLAEVEQIRTYERTQTSTYICDCRHIPSCDEESCSAMIGGTREGIAIPTPGTGWANR
jgi:hypothetical protein